MIAGLMLMTMGVTVLIVVGGAVLAFKIGVWLEEQYGWDIVIGSCVGMAIELIAVGGVLLLL